MLVARARGLEFVGRLTVAADKDGGSLESGDGVDDGLESFALGGVIAGADEDVAGANAGGEGFDGAKVAVDVAEGEDSHGTLPGGMGEPVMVFVDLSQRAPVGRR